MSMLHDAFLVIKLLKLSIFKCEMVLLVSSRSWLLCLTPAGNVVVIFLPLGLVFPSVTPAPAFPFLLIYRESRTTRPFSIGPHIHSLFDADPFTHIQTFFYHCTVILIYFRPIYKFPIRTFSTFMSNTANSCIWTTCCWGSTFSWNQKQF